MGKTSLMNDLDTITGLFKKRKLSMHGFVICCENLLNEMRQYYLTRHEKITVVGYARYLRQIKK